VRRVLALVRKNVQTMAYYCSTRRLRGDAGCTNGKGIPLKALSSSWSTPDHSGGWTFEGTVDVAGLVS